MGLHLQSRKWSDATLWTHQIKDLVRYFAKLGFEGPYSGGKHQFMIKGHVTIRIPNPHKTDIGKELLRRILHQTGISRDVWEEL